MKKISVALGALALGLAALTGCDIKPEEGKAWAEANGYSITLTDEEKAEWALANGYILETEAPTWATENGYVVNPAATLPSVVDQNAFGNGSAAITINPAKYGTKTEATKELASFLNRSDVVYIDLRPFSDYANGHIEGFECIPFFDIIFAQGGAKDDAHLFYKEGTNFLPRFEESAEVLKSLVPTDKVVFLMCASGGRVESMMGIMKACGYDMTKVYNVGGWNHYTDTQIDSVLKAKYGVSVLGDAAVNAIQAVLKIDNLTKK